MGELDGHREIITVCHHGVRSLVALEILRAAGFPKVRNLRGGVDAWARDVDPSMAAYCQARYGQNDRASEGSYHFVYGRLY